MLEPVVAVHRLRELPADPARLSALERAVVPREAPWRQREWIRGRVGARRLLARWLGAEVARQVSLTVAPDGGPRVVGRADLAASLSHDEGLLAVAWARGSGLGVDLCHRRHRARLRPILRRLGLAPAALAPEEVWAALESALKLRRLGVTALLDARLELRADLSGWRLDGLGAPVAGQLAGAPAYALAWASEAR